MAKRFLTDEDKTELQTDIEGAKSVADNASVVAQQASVTAQKAVENAGEVKTELGYEITGEPPTISPEVQAAIDGLTAADVGALPLDGSVPMTGALFLKNRRTRLYGNEEQMSVEAWNSTGSNNRRYLSVYNAEAQPDVMNGLEFTDVVDGEYNFYKVYGEHNPPPITMDLLWENASPTSNFAKQDIAVDTTPYKFFITQYKTGTNGVALFTHVSPNTTGIHCIRYVRTASEIRVRDFTFSADKITFENAHLESNSATDNAILIPTRIYGIN